MRTESSPLLRTALTLAGVMAIVLGILAMHMWMSGHGTAGHTTSAAVASPGPIGQHHVMTASTAHESPSPADALSATDCGGMMIAGACAMTIVVISIVVALALRNRPIYGLPSFRAPPRIAHPHRTRPYTPSLVQLCISRT